MRVVGQGLLGVGAVLMALAGIGVLRLPDVYARLQAGTKAASLGLACVFAGTVLLLPTPSVAVKLGLALVFQLLTAPLAAHVIGRAAYRAGIPAWRLDVDELADRTDDRPREDLRSSVTPPRPRPRPGSGSPQAPAG